MCQADVGLCMQIMAKHRMAHDKFSMLATKLVKAAPPCMSSSDDWEPTAAALEELSLTLENGNPAATTPLPDASGERPCAPLTPALAKCGVALDDSM